MLLFSWSWGDQLFFDLIEPNNSRLEHWMWSGDLQNLDVFGIAGNDDLFSAVLHVDVIRARSNKCSWMISDFL